MPGRAALRAATTAAMAAPSLKAGTMTDVVDASATDYSRFPTLVVVSSILPEPTAISIERTR